jgi:signal transduction histidine kinase
VAGPARSQSLLSKVIVAVSLAVLGVEAAALGPLMWLYRQQLVEERRERVEESARLLLARRDERMLGLGGAAVFDAERRRVAGPALGGGSPAAEAAALAAIGHARAFGAPVTLEARGWLAHAVPLAVGLPPEADPWSGATLVVATPLETVSGKLLDQVVIAMGTMLGLLLMTGAATIVALYRHILRPIAALTEANRALVQGDAGGALVPEREIPDDELGDAIRSRNAIHERMLEYQRSIREKSEVLEAQRGELSRWARELEKRVREKSEELFRAHDRLLESEKLAAAGRLAAGVAHEINNPLASIAGYAEDLLQLAKDPRLAGLHAFQEFPESLAVIEEQAFRCKRIIRQLLSFARPSEFAPAPLDLAQVVDDVLPLVEHKGRGRDISIVVEEEPGAPNALADRTHLVQVLVNLIENAFDAIAGPSGEVRIRTRRAEPRTAESLGAVAIDVSDTGVGIQEADRKKIFEPFYTTKPPGKGTGLGLSICHSIVSRMGGRIEVSSRPGRGATFSVVLPATAELAVLEAR